MKKALLAFVCIASASLLVSCGGENAQNGKKSEGKAPKAKFANYDEMKKSGFAVKYDYEGSTYIFTRKGSSIRFDCIDSDGQHSVGIETDAEDGGYTGYKYEDGQWQDNSISGRQKANNAYSSLVRNKAKYLDGKGYSKTGSEEICGQSCDVYSGALTETLYIEVYPGFHEVGSKGEFAVWNDITLGLKLEGKELMKATALSFDIPDEAFTKTTDITWI